MGYNPCEECSKLDDAAVDHCSTCRLDLAEEQVSILNKEVESQCKLNGSGAEREYILLGKIERLEKELAIAKTLLRVSPDDFDQLSEMGEQILASRKRMEEVMERLNKK